MRPHYAARSLRTATRIIPPAARDLGTLPDYLDHHFAPSLPGDFNFHLTVNAADLAWWESKFTTTAATLTQIPEPTAATLLLFATAICIATLRR